MGPDGKCRSVDVRTSNGILNRLVQRLYPMELHVPDEPVAAGDTSSPSESVTAMTPETAAEIESTYVSSIQSTVLSNVDPTWECVGRNDGDARFAFPSDFRLYKTPTAMLLYSILARQFKKNAVVSRNQGSNLVLVPSRSSLFFANPHPFSRFRGTQPMGMLTIQLNIHDIHDIHYMYIISFFVINIFSEWYNQFVIRLIDIGR